MRGLGAVGRLWIRTFLGENSEALVTSTNVLSANYPTPNVFNLAISTAGGRQYVSMRCDGILKVLGIKRVTGPRKSGTSKYKYLIVLYTLTIH